MSSIFSKIINGDIPCYKIAEDDSFLAFLDINMSLKCTIFRQSYGSALDLKTHAFGSQKKNVAAPAVFSIQVCQNRNDLAYSSSIFLGWNITLKLDQKSAKTKNGH